MSYQNNSSIYSLPNGTYGAPKPSFWDKVTGETNTNMMAATRDLNPHTTTVTDKYIRIERDNGHHSVYNKETMSWDSYTS